MVTHRQSVEKEYDVYTHIIALFLTCPTAKIESADMNVYLGMCFGQDPEITAGSQMTVTALIVAFEGGLIELEPEGHKMYMVAGPNLKQLAACRSDLDMLNFLATMQAGK